MKPYDFLKVVVLASLAVTGSSAASAADWPNRPITMIVPYAPGGAVDITARLLQKPLSNILGQPIIVDNKAGGGGIPAAESLVHATPDGYTIGLFASNFISSTIIEPHIASYDALNDITPITLVANNTTLIVVPENSKIRTLADLVAQATAKPNTIGFATPGFGTAQHLAAELFMLQAHIKMVNVPYRGAGPATTDVVAGHVPVGFLGIGPTVPFVRSNKLRALAITTSPRSPLLPNVPTVAEQGYPHYDYGEWFAMIAPKGIPASVVAKLHSAIVQVVKSPQFKKRLTALGLEAHATTRAQLMKFLQNARVQIQLVVAKTHMKVE